MKINKLNIIYIHNYLNARIQYSHNLINRNSWYIKKRYSEIYEIYNYLVNHKPKLEFPLFPPKRLFSTKESTVIERKNGFEDVFCFILQNIEILQYQKLIEFFKIKKTLLMIYIKNCFLVNEKRFSYELMDENNSSFNSSDISLGSDKGYKEKKMSQSIKIKINKKIKTKQKDENLFNKSEKENIVGNNLKDAPIMDSRTDVSRITWRQDCGGTQRPVMNEKWRKMMQYPAATGLR